MANNYVSLSTNSTYFDASDGMPSWIPELRPKGENSVPAPLFGYTPRDNTPGERYRASFQNRSEIIPFYVEFKCSDWPGMPGAGQSEGIDLSTVTIRKPLAVPYPTKITMESFNYTHPHTGLTNIGMRARFSGIFSTDPSLLTITYRQGKRPPKQTKYIQRVRGSVVKFVQRSGMRDTTILLDAQDVLGRGYGLLTKLIVFPTWGIPWPGFPELSEDTF